MKAFVAVLSLLAMASADQSSHQTIKHGNAPAVHTSVHKPHGIPHATVVSQPSAQPSEVHQPYNEEKYSAGVHAPAHHVKAAPYHAAPVHHAPAYHAAPVHHAPAYHAAPVHHAAPAYHAPHPAPAYKPAPHPAPAYKPAPHPAPAYKPAPHHPASYKEPEYGPAVYQYGYAVADDYTGANFAANENRNDYSTQGEYRVNLPDGRTQIVTYNVADAYSGYVADVRYEGEAHYEPAKPAYKPAHPAPAYKPAHPAPAYKPVHA